MSLQVKVKESGLHPEVKSEEAAGFDLKSAIQLTIYPNQIISINTGIYVAIPKGFFGAVVSRSGIARDHGIHVLNAPGIIDSDYRGEISVILHNASEEPFLIKKYDRIAQMILIPYGKTEIELVDDLPETVRGSNGFGSTGI